MFIEKKLRNEYELAAGKVHIDPALDSKIERLAKKEFAGKPRLHKGMRFRPKLVHVAAAFALTTGFGYATHSLLYKIDEGSVQMEVQARKDFTLTQITPKEIRLELASVENKLATGETALVYFAALEKEKHPLFQQNPMIGIEKPDVVKDWKAWTAVLSEEASLSHALPHQLPDSFSFLEGKQGTPYGVMMGQEGQQWLHELQEESKETGKNVVWKVVPQATSPIQAYTSLYENEQKERIFVTVEKFPKEQLDVQLSTPETTKYDAVTVSGKKAHYTKNDQFLFSESGQYQELSWLDQDGEQPIMYRIATDSPTVSKEMLVQAAKASQQ
ncbi:hypothetical protein BBR47_12140 [Brevibacillus brevis NBRC 100599]|uniref:DUF4367 domain-containing protein n=1 Tax=Brevibacillus brevis (strain 47 / JCM 6285 / NBRC 100599) TaxID=358681 RepID=C0Z7E8_BREBN|nr:hypothetical protein [Brevibacillus brevis]BAH42191.1 hypothetical protein BBR47_12140 [Brevibacillus brevis NBRC 100599]